MTTIVRIECVSCGWHTCVGEELGCVLPNPDAIARNCAAHFEGCPKRTKGHPAFGFTPRWLTYQLAHGEVVQLAWSNELWGFPFDLAAAVA